MKLTIFTMAASVTLINITSVCAQVNSASSSALTGTLSSYNGALNQQLQASDQSISDQLRNYNTYATQLQDDMNKVKAWAHKCSPFGGRVGTAVDAANARMKVDTDTMNGQLQPLIVSVQTSTVDRSPAALTSGVACEAAVQANVANTQGLIGSVTTTASSLQTSVGSDLASAQQNLRKNDRTLQGLLSPSDWCPPQASQDYNQAKQDFANLYASYNGVQASLTNTSSLATSKMSSFSSQRTVCSSVASQ